MIELLLVIYAFSGLIKSLLISAGLELPIDFTLTIIILLVIFTLKKFYSKNKLNLEFIKQKSRQQILAIIVLFLFYVLILFSVFKNYNLNLDYPESKAFYFLTNFIPVFVLFLSPQLNLKIFARYFISFALFFCSFYFLTSPNSKYYEDNELFILNYKSLKSVGLLIGIKGGIAAILLLNTYKDRFWRISLFSFFVFITFYTASRGSFLLLIIVLSVFLILRYKKFLSLFQNLDKPFVLKSIGFLFLSLSTIIVLININQYRYDTLKRASVRMGILVNHSKEIMTSDSSENNERNISITNQGDDQKNDVDKNRSVNYRIWHLNWVLDKVKERDVFLTGIGFGTYGYYCCDLDGRSNYPHNIFLESFVELGIFGLILILIYIIITHISWFNKVKIDHVIFIGLAFLYIFLNSLKSFSLVDLRDFFIFSSILIFIHSKSKIKRNKT